MTDPRRENLNAVSGDSLRNNERDNMSIQTEWSFIRANNYEDYAEESSRPLNLYMIGAKVDKRFGERMYEGSVEVYNSVTNKFKVMYENGHYDEIDGDNIVNYLAHHRNDVTGDNFSPRASVQPSKEPCGYPTKDMATAEAKREGKGRKRPLVLNAKDAGGSSQPRQALKSSCRGLRTCKNVNPMAKIEPSSGVGNEEREGNKVQNAGDVSRPKQAGKQRGQSLGIRCQERENITQVAPVQQSQVQPSKEPGGCPTKDMATAEAKREGKGRKKPLVSSAKNAGGSSRPRQALKFSCKGLRTCEHVNPMAAIEPSSGVGIEERGGNKARNAGDVSRPKRAGKQRGQSLGSRCQERENITQVAPVQQSFGVGNDGRGEYTALLIRAENAGDVCRPRKARKRRGQSAGSKRQKCKNIAQGAPVQQSSDVGNEGRGGQRVEKVADVGRPRQAGNQRGQSSGNNLQNCENTTQGVPLHQYSDVGTVKKGRYRALRMRAINA